MPRDLSATGPWRGAKRGTALGGTAFRGVSG